MYVKISEHNEQVLPKETRIVNTPVNGFFQRTPHAVMDSKYDN